MAYKVPNMKLNTTVSAVNMFFFLQVSESDESSAAGIKCNSRKGLLSVELPHISYNNPGGGGRQGQSTDGTTGAAAAAAAELSSSLWDRQTAGPALGEMQP